MIAITNGQPVPESDYTVKNGGNYQDEDLVVCVNAEGYEAAYQAYFIVNGNCKGEG